MVELVLAKDWVRVRFPASAHTTKIASFEAIFVVCRESKVDLLARAHNIKNTISLWCFLYCALGRNRTHNNGSEDRCDIHFTTSALNNPLILRNIVTHFTTSADGGTTE